MSGQCSRMLKAGAQATCGSRAGSPAGCRVGAGCVTLLRNSLLAGSSATEHFIPLAIPVSVKSNSNTLVQHGLYFETIADKEVWKIKVETTLWLFPLCLKRSPYLCYTPYMQIESCIRYPLEIIEYFRMFTLFFLLILLGFAMKAEVLSWNDIGASS